MGDLAHSQSDFSYEVIADAGRAAPALSRLTSENLVGLDTETIWDAPGESNRVSLVQVATEAGKVFVFDALALGAEIFRPLVESEGVSKAAHNARFDQAVLAGAGLRPVGMVDTLTLARMAVSLPSHSLASVAEHLFGARLDKSLQKSNWRRRPLAPAQLAYAAIDAHTTLRVYHELVRLLSEQGRLEPALRAATLSPRPEGDAPRRRRRPAPAPGPPLTPAEKKTVARLKRWRLALANSQGRPAYMICPDRTLEHLARDLPRTLDALRSIHGLGDSKIAQFGEALLRELNEEGGGKT